MKHLYLYFFLFTFLNVLSSCNNEEGNEIPETNTITENSLNSLNENDALNCEDCCIKYEADWCRRCAGCDCCINCACDPCGAQERPQEEIALYTNFKENFLSTTPFGRKFHYLYNRNTARIVELLQSNLTLSTNFGQLLGDLAPICDNLINGDGSMILDISILERIDAMLLEIADINQQVAETPHGEQARLAQNIGYLRNKVNIQSLVGQSVSSAWNTAKNTTP